MDNLNTRPQTSSARDNRLVALLDWDGTLSSGFMIVRWSQFLSRHGAVSADLASDIEKTFGLYYSNSITHEESSRRSAAIYAAYLRGLKRSEIEAQASSFVTEDRTQLYSFTNYILSYLAKRGIRPILISGAPSEPLRLYSKMMGIGDLYALELAGTGGLFAGHVKFNPGIQDTKLQIVKTIQSQIENSIVLSMGDAAADLPMFDASPTCIIVDNPGITTNGRCLHLNSNAHASERVIRFLEESL